MIYLIRFIRSIVCQIRGGFFGKIPIHTNVLTGTRFKGNYIKAGKHVSIGSNTKIDIDVVLHDYVLIAHDVLFTGNDHSYTEVGTPIRYSGKPFPKKDTVVERDVWIGARCIIMAGVCIGEGAVVASGTIVTKNIGPYEIHGGVPNRLLKHRFSPVEAKNHRNILDSYEGSH